MSRFQKILVFLSITGFLVFILFLAALLGIISESVGMGEMSAYKESRPHLAVFRIEGPIFSAAPYLKQLRAVSENSECSGLLVRINSPGGAVGASQEIYDALKELRSTGLPVVVSLGNVAASGGYYIAMGGGTIFASRGTLTGSIGVIARFADAEKLFDKLGVSMNVYKSGKLKDAGSPFRRPTSEEKKYLLQVVNESHNQFTDDICTARNLSREAVAIMADGRLLTGAAALESGLIDTLGGMEAARRFLAEKSVLKKPIFKETLKKKPWLEKILTSILPFQGPVSKGLEALMHPGLYYIWPGSLSGRFSGD